MEVICTTKVNMEDVKFAEGKLNPKWYIAEEEVHGIKAGRVKNAVSNLYCEECGKVVIVDDSFDGEWQYRRYR